MKKIFNIGKNHSYFQGWYLKQQNDTETAALIPAYHVNDKGEACASLQVITDSGACNIRFPANLFHADTKKFLIQLDHCVFSPLGCVLDIKSEECNIHGALRFGPFAPPKYDIMGPFAAVPFMECRHSVVSMLHSVDGALTINKKEYSFENSVGYIEGDRGCSFPKRYMWTQCCHNGSSIMLSVADIPLGLHSFVGLVGSIYMDGKEHRIATYLGAKLLHQRRLRYGQAGTIVADDKAYSVQQPPSVCPPYGQYGANHTRKRLLHSSIHLRGRRKTDF